MMPVWWRIIYFLDTTDNLIFDLNVEQDHGKRVSQSPALKVHMRTHAGEKPWRCYISLSDPNKESMGCLTQGNGTLWLTTLSCIRWNDCCRFFVCFIKDAFQLFKGLLFLLLYIIDVCVIKSHLFFGHFGPPNISFKCRAGSWQDTRVRVTRHIHHLSFLSHN